MKSTVLAVWTLAVLGLTACPGSGDVDDSIGDGGGLLVGGTTGGSSGAADFACDTMPGGGGHSCTSYSWTGAPAAYTDQVKMACTAAGGTSPANCPTSNVLGVCTYTNLATGVPSLKVTYKLFWYQQAGLSASLAEMTCTKANQPGRLETKWSTTP